MKLLRRAFYSAAASAACVLTMSLLATTPCSATQIPAWLDDAITSYNEKNPETPINFVAIKDSYVWYSVNGSAGLSSKEVRSRVYGIAQTNGYSNTQDEEIVTTGKPPTSSPAKTRKCWTRSFLRDVQKGSPTTVERMLTTLVCEDDNFWTAGFRILQ